MKKGVAVAFVCLSIFLLVSMPIVSAGWFDNLIDGIKDFFSRERMTGHVIVSSCGGTNTYPCAVLSERDCETTWQCWSDGPECMTRLCSTWDDNSLDRCDSAPGCTFYECGDEVVNGAETCDGNSQLCNTGEGYAGTQSCLVSCEGWGACTSTQLCGDGSKNGPEDCDAGDNNGIPGSGCLADCTYPTNEECKGTVTTTCRLYKPEATCESHDECWWDDSGIGYCKERDCEDENSVSICINNLPGCDWKYCGDSEVTSSLGEQCDDGNTDDTDTCSNLCQTQSAEGGGAGTCGGTATACSDITTLNVCGQIADVAQYGCSWIYGANICTGTATACSDITTLNVCGQIADVAQYGCSWTETSTCTDEGNILTTKESCTDPIDVAWDSCEGVKVVQYECDMDGLCGRANEGNAESCGSGYECSDGACVEIQEEVLICSDQGNILTVKEKCTNPISAGGGILWDSCEGVKVIQYECDMDGLCGRANEGNAESCGSGYECSDGACVVAGTCGGGAVENCSNQIDDNCDGNVNEGCVYYSINSLAFQEGDIWENAEIMVSCLFNVSMFNSIEEPPISVATGCVVISFDDSYDNCDWVYDGINPDTGEYYRSFKCDVGEVGDDKPIQCVVNQNICVTKPGEFASSHAALMSVTTPLVCPAGIDATAAAFNVGPSIDLVDKELNLGERLIFNWEADNLLATNTFDIISEAGLYELNYQVEIDKDIENIILDSSSASAEFSLDVPSSAPDGKYRIYVRTIDANANQFCMLDKYDVSIIGAGESIDPDDVDIDFRGDRTQSANINKLEKLYFTFDGVNMHEIEVIDVSSTSADLEIRSNPILLTLDKGEQQQIDVDSDGVLDLLIKLNSITGEQISLDLEALEPFTLCIPGEIRNCGVNDEGTQFCSSSNVWEKCTYNSVGGSEDIIDLGDDDEDVDSDSNFPWWIVLVVFIIILIVFIMIIFLKRKFNKKISGGSSRASQYGQGGPGGRRPPSSSPYEKSQRPVQRPMQRPVQRRQI